MTIPALAAVRMSVPATDGLVLEGTLTYPANGAGRKSPLAVLAHQYPATRDSWAPLAADLLATGVAVLAFDMRGHGRSTRASAGTLVVDTPAGGTLEDFGAAFVSSIGKVGFHHIADDIVRVAGWGVSQNFIDGSRVLLAGASVGGTGVLLAAPTFGAALRGTLTFGAAGAPAHGEDAATRIRANIEAIRAPFFLASSEGDPFVGAANVRAWSEGLSHVTARIVPGGDHAMAIYYDVRQDVLDFVRPLVG
jgi:pimeloyl-ACP methyl ester carboxylesterase